MIKVEWLIKAIRNLGNQLILKNAKDKEFFFQTINAGFEYDIESRKSEYYIKE